MFASDRVHAPFSEAWIRQWLKEESAFPATFYKHGPVTSNSIAETSFNPESRFETPSQRR